MPIFSLSTDDLRQKAEMLKLSLIDTLRLLNQSVSEPLPPEALEQRLASISRATDAVLNVSSSPTEAQPPAAGLPSTPPNQPPS